MQIKVYENGERDAYFYSTVGKLSLSKDVTKELHDTQYGSIYDEDYAVWFVAHDADKLIGVAAIFDKKKELFLDHCYVLPEYRGKGLGQQLFEYRQAYAENISGKRPIKAITMNEVQYHIYQKFGFVLASKRGKYFWVKKEVLN